MNTIMQKQFTFEQISVIASSLGLSVQQYSRGNARCLHIVEDMSPDDLSDEENPTEYVLARLVCDSPDFSPEGWPKNLYRVEFISDSSDYRGFASCAATHGGRVDESDNLEKVRVALGKSASAK